MLLLLLLLLLLLQEQGILRRGEVLLPMRLRLHDNDRLLYDNRGAMPSFCACGCSGLLLRERAAARDVRWRRRESLPQQTGMFR
jgi:hypothetical protein